MLSHSGGIEGLFSTPTRPSARPLLAPDRQAVPGRSNNVHVDAVVAQRDREPEHERAGGIPRLAGE